MGEWETKDSGKRQEFDSGMRRDTRDGKARFNLLIPKGVPYKEQMLTRVAELMARGAVKYTARNWELANSEEELERCYESAYRHFMQWICGENDEDHAAGLIFNVLAAETLRYKLERAANTATVTIEPDTSQFKAAMQRSRELLMGRHGR